jgi:8-oxo-dGTP pyrophosphatase MutT (NUDIX family)
MRTTFQAELVQVFSKIKSIESQTGNRSKIGSIEAAVLVPLVEIAGQWNILLTKRTDTVATHRGEISFPGGAREVSDKDLIDTALRETEEEIGLTRESISVIGVMQSFETVSRFIITPVIGILSNPFSLNLNHEEVDEVLYYELGWIKQKRNRMEIDFKDPSGYNRKVIKFRRHKNEIVWGITAKIIDSFINLIK